MLFDAGRGAGAGLTIRTSPDVWAEPDSGSEVTMSLWLPQMSTVTDASLSPIPKKREIALT